MHHTIAQPTDALTTQIHTQILRHIYHIRKISINGMPLGLQFHYFAIYLQHILKVVSRLTGFAIHPKFIAVAAPFKGQGPAGMLLLGQAIQVSRIADLGLNLFLAVAVIVIRYQGDNNPTLITGG